MDKAYPILIILTNKGCSHCTTMRGVDGWPSNSNPISFKGKYGKWNNDFFKALLTGDHIGSPQKTRVIELFFDSLSSKCKLIEVTFFDLFVDNNELNIKKYSPKGNKSITLNKLNKNGFVDSKEIKGMNFDQFVDKYIPLDKIKKYFHIFPSFIYVHSTIWNEALEKDKSFFARVQGFETVRDGSDHTMYKILRESNPNHEEREKNPVDVIKRLLAFNLEPLYFPVDHNTLQ